ncbi:MAG TPA: hypothetical protein VFP68_03570 [Burkholderiaceae bacterium]|nr:hypothetical protein [Burkholderiaceae bacterium]
MPSLLSLRCRLQPAARVYFPARLRRVACVAGAFSLVVASPAVTAMDEEALVASHAPRTLSRSVEVDARAAASARAPVQQAPATATGLQNDAAAVRMNVVRWANVGRGSSVGVAVGVSNAPGEAFTAAPMPVLDPRHATLLPEVGLRWRSKWDERRLDVNAWSSYDATLNTPQSERRSYNARVELQFMPQPATALETPKGAIGFQMSANSQMVLRAKARGPMVYYRKRW